MKQVLRVIILICLLLGVIGLAQDQVAWAANPSEGTTQASLQRDEKSVSPDKDDYCDKAWNRRKDECKDRDKDKDKCKKHKKDCGSVKPPPEHIIITGTGEYSVGGFCTLSIAFDDPAIALDTSIEIPLPRELPDQAHKVRQGCHLIYYASGKRIGELPTDSGTATICFAAVPQKQMTLYFNNIYAPKPTWVPLATTVQNGIACASAPKSGVYVGTFQSP